MPGWSRSVGNRDGGAGVRFSNADLFSRSLPKNSTGSNIFGFATNEILQIRYGKVAQEDEHG